MNSNRLNQLLAFHESNPEDAFIQFALAKEYEMAGDDDKALHAYLQLVEKHPNYVGTYYHLGKLYEKLNNFNRAFGIYKQGMVIALQENDRHAHDELAAAKLNLGDDEDFA